MAAPPPYDHGYSNYVYTVLEDAHIGGTKLPMRSMAADRGQYQLWRPQSGESCLPLHHPTGGYLSYRSTQVINAESYNSDTGIRLVEGKSSEEIGLIRFTRGLIK